LDIGDLPFGALSNFTGTVRGDWAINGDPANPQTSFSLAASGLAPAGFHEDERFPSISFAVDGGVTNGSLSASTHMKGKRGGHLDASLSIPCRLSVFPMAFELAPEELAMQLETAFDLDGLNEYEFLQQQRVQGRLDCRVDYNPGRTSGYLELMDGSYEHYDHGVMFKDLNATFDLKEDGFMVQNAYATDGAAGRVGMSGGFSRLGWDLRVDLDDAWILRQDAVDASVSGWIKAAGPVGRPDISGKLTINRAEVLLDNVVGEPPERIVDYERGKTNAVVDVEGEEKLLLPFGLDLEVIMPDQVFVVASMIDAVLGGRLHFRDTPEGISVAGQIQPRRGYVSFIGKKFRFIDGDIMLDGSVPAITTLENVTAEYTRKDFTARLILNGRAEDPIVRLESTPSMPEDELLSHVLFNRDTSTITAYQAYQVAMAARQLANGLKGPGFMYQLKQAVGVDTLEWREGDGVGEGSSVAAGKYITTGLYIEVDRSLEDEGGTAMSAEYEINRNFSIETYTGPQMRPGIGLNWRKDY
jgi:autotransporter translocation and assembly factor TamB